MNSAMTRNAIQLAILNFPQVCRTKMLIRSVVYIPDCFAGAIGAMAFYALAITANYLQSNPSPIITLKIGVSSLQPLVFVFVGFHAVCMLERIFFLSTHTIEDTKKGATNDQRQN